MDREMNRYGMPQNTDIAVKSSQPLRVIVPPVWYRCGHPLLSLQLQIQGHFSFISAICFILQRRQTETLLSKKRRCHMHDIEQQPSQDDATMVKITGLPPQEERQMARGAGVTLTTKEPERPRRPFATRYLAAGGLVLLALAVIFSTVLLRGRSPSQPVTGAAPVQHQPSSQPTPTGSRSITII